MKPRLIYKISMYLVAAIISSLAFQNCSLEAPIKFNEQSVFKTSGNGDGYGGKVTTYTNSSLPDLCQDGSSIRSAIVVDSKTNRAYQTREDCRDIQEKPLDFSSLNLLPHNPEIIPLSRLYQDSSLTTYSEIMCRGSSNQLGSSNTQIVDVLISSSLSGGLKSYFGEIKLGVYDQNSNLIQSFKSGQVKVGPPTISLGGNILYTSLATGLQQAFTLDVRPDYAVGMVTYAVDLNLQESTISEAPLSPTEIPVPGRLYIVNNLKCFVQ